MSQGSGSQLSFGLEVAEGIGGPLTSTMPFISESLSTDRPLVENPNIDPSGLDPDTENLVVAGQGAIRASMDVETLLPFRAHHGGHYEKTELSAGSAGAAAVGLITMAGIAAADETFIVDGRTFTWKPARTGPGEVTIGADGAAAAANLISAINLDLTSVFASVGVGDTVRVTAAAMGVAGNAIPFSTTATNMTVNGAGFLGGTTPGVNVVSAVNRIITRHREKTEAASAEPVLLDSMGFEIYRDDNRAHRLFGAKCDVFTMKATEGKYVEFDHSFQWARDTDLGDPVASGGNNAAGAAIVVIMRGHRGDMDSTEVLHVKATTGGVLDGAHAKVAFAIGAGAYGTDTYFVTSGRPIRAKINGVEVGNPGQHEHVEVILYAPTPATDVLTVGDVFTSAANRLPSLLVPSDARKLTAVGAEGEVTIGGVTKTYAIHDITLTYTRPRKRNTGLGTKYAFGVNDNGRETCIATLSRDYTDLDFYIACIARKEVALSVPCYGDMLAGNQQEMYHPEILHARIGKAGSVVSTQTMLPENIELRAFRKPGTTDPLMKETFVTKASL